MSRVDSIGKRLLAGMAESGRVFCRLGGLC